MVKLSFRAMVTTPAVVSTRTAALSRYFQISLYFMLVVSVLTLVSTGKLDVVTIVVPIVALAVKGYRGWRGFPPELSSRAATWLVVGYLAFFPADLWWLSRILASDAENPALFSALLAAIHLMLFAMIVRLYSAKVTRDYLFLTLLAFSSMLAAAILTVDTTSCCSFFCSWRFLSRRSSAWKCSEARRPLLPFRSKPALPPRAAWTRR